MRSFSKPLIPLNAAKLVIIPLSTKYLKKYLIKNDIFIDLIYFLTAVFALGNNILPYSSGVDNKRTASFNVLS